MDINVRSKLAPVVAALALGSLGGCPGPAAEEDPVIDTTPFPAKGGIKPGLSLASLTSISGGWTVCDTSTYGETVPDFIPPLNGCPGAYMMLACGQAGSDTLSLAAADDRSIVMLEDAFLSPPHVANGVGWYFDPLLSIGFAPAGSPLSGRTDVSNPCEYASPATEGSTASQRLCWVADAGDLYPGCRCGADGTPDQPFTGTWTRYILVHD